MPTALLISNRDLGESGGRPAKFAHRKSYFEDRGWDLEIVKVNPTIPGVLMGVSRCLRAVRKHRPDVIMTVCNPPHLHLVGLLLSYLIDTNWVAEYRDPLVTIPEIEPGSFSMKFRKLLERRVVHRADRTLWIDGIQMPDDYFTDEYPDVQHDRIRKLPPMGYTSERFEDASAENFDSFTVLYAGSLYDGWIEPYDFLHGFSNFANSTDSQITARFYGDWAHEYSDAAKDLGVEDLITPTDFIPFDEFVPKLKGADILLYIGGTDPRNHRNIPSKIYDYIGAGNPILMIGDPSFRTAKLIEEYNLGIVVQPSDHEGISTALHSFLENSFVYDPHSRAMGEFTRERFLDHYLDELNALS